MLVQPEYVALHQQMWARQAQAVVKASPARQQHAAAVRAAARASLADLTQRTAPQPPDVALYPHQLQVLNVLRRMWAMGRHAVMADEPVSAGMGTDSAEPGW